MVAYRALRVWRASCRWSTKVNGGASMSETVSIADCQIPERNDDGHKGTFGRVLIVAGSDGMSGAACLAGKAALRGGAGLVTVMVPKCIQAIVAGYEPGYMTVGYDAAAVSLEDAILGNSGQSVEFLKVHAADKCVVAIGPGLDTGADAQQLVKSAVRELPCPVVLDADALNVCAEGGFLSKGLDNDGRAGDRIVTPHPGEFARLLGTTVAEVQANRVEMAQSFAKQFGLIVVLKGPETVVTDGERIYLNDTGNSGMATGGSGDVLSGLLAAIIGQQVSAFDAACVAVWLHGAAGDSAAEAFSRESLIASDLPQHFGRAWRSLRSTVR